ncbi:MAG: hypothetical protein K6F14_06820 [Clostridiales bacterium]|nr:hypothetical protein [Clostridiales bacterium]
MKKIFNKRGESYTIACVLILLLSIMMATAMYFAVATMRIQAIKKEVKNILDSVCSEFSIDSYGSVKQDLYYLEPMKRVEISGKTYALLGFEDEDRITLSDGTVMHRPTLTITFNGGTSITADFLIESSDGIYKANLSITGGFLRKYGN